MRKNEYRGQVLANKHRILFKKYILENPLISNYKLADMIITENKFSLTTDHVSRAIGYLRLEKAPAAINLDDDEIKLPESLYQEYLPVMLPNVIERLAVLSDIHIPYHDNNALRTALKWLKEHSPGAIMLNGDIMDMHTVSKFLKDPKTKGIVSEIATGREFMEILRSLFPGIPIYYYFGNHEERWQHFLWRKAEDVAGLDSLELTELLQLYDYEIQPITERRCWKFGNISGLHGHEYGLSGNAINIARLMQMRAFEPILFGHFHQTMNYTTVSLSGTEITAHAVGCLAGLRPDYSPLSKHNHGFAEIELDGDNTIVHNYRFKFGKITEEQ